MRTLPYEVHRLTPDHHAHRSTISYARVTRAYRATRAIRCAAPSRADQMRDTCRVRSASGGSRCSADPTADPERRGPDGGRAAPKIDSGGSPAWTSVAAQPTPSRRGSGHSARVLHSQVSRGEMSSIPLVCINPPRSPCSPTQQHHRIWTLICFALTDAMHAGDIFRTRPHREWMGMPLPDLVIGAP